MELYQSESECPLAFSWLCTPAYTNTLTHWMYTIYKTGGSTKAGVLCTTETYLSVKQMSLVLSSSKINATSDLMWQYARVSWVLHPAQPSAAPEATEGRTLQIQHLTDGNTWDWLVIELMWLYADEKSWPLSGREQKSGNFLSATLFFPLLLYLRFICLPAARPSSGSLWGVVGGESFQPWLMWFR